MSLNLFSYADDMSEEESPSPRSEEKYALVCFFLT